MLGDTVTREEVVGGEWGVFDGVVDEYEQTPTPATPRAVAPYRRIPREVAVGGGLGEFGFLDTRHLDTPVDQEGG